jgi:transposase
MALARHRLTDQQWGVIEDVFPKPAATGRPPVKPRDMMDAILWRLRTGSPWRDLPEEFGPWKTVFNHFDKWNSDGTLDEIKRRLLRRVVDGGGISTDLWCVDGTIIRAARCAAGGGKKAIPTNRTIMR